MQAARTTYTKFTSVAFLLVAWLVAVSAARAAGGPFVGVDLGVSEPLNDNYRAHTHTGATGDPYFGYMFNDYLGVQGQLHFTFQLPDNDHRGFKGENTTTTLFGGTIGPRLSVPLGSLVELYGTWQPGYFTGLSGRLNHSDWGWSAGGGVDFNLTPNFAMGLYTRYNRVFITPRPDLRGLPGDEGVQIADQGEPTEIEFLTGGMGMKYSFGRPAAAPPPPPPPPVAAVPPPPPPPVKKKIVLRNVHFDFDKSNIRADARPVLDEAVQILKSENIPALIVEGHTDGVGSVPYNQKLSERRAEAVCSYLAAHGIAASRIKTAGYGKTKPVASNDTDEGRAENRRVELRID